MTHFKNLKKENNFSEHGKKVISKGHKKTVKFMIQEKGGKQQFI